MRAIGGKSEQLLSLANHEESLVVPTAVQSISGVVADRSCIDNAFAGRSANGSLRTYGRSCSEDQKFFAIHAAGRVLSLILFHSPDSIFKYQTRDSAPMYVLAAVDRENKPKSQSRLHPADGPEIGAESQSSQETIMSRISLIQLGFS